MPNNLKTERGKRHRTLVETLWVGAPSHETLLLLEEFKKDEEREHVKIPKGKRGQRRKRSGVRASVHLIQENVRLQSSQEKKKPQQEVFRKDRRYVG